MKYNNTKTNQLLALSLIAFLTAQCAAIDSLSSNKTIFNVAMTGMDKIPDSATGNRDPAFESFTLNSVTLTREDGSTVDGFANDPKTLRIINRPQIISSADLGSDIGTTFTKVTVQFDPNVQGGGRYQSDLKITLPTGELSYSTPFKISKAQSRRLDIWVNWQNTLDENNSDKTDSLQVPSFELSLTPN